MSELALPPMFGGFNCASVAIAASPERIWTILRDRKSWMDQFLAKELIDGPENALGERASWLSRAPDGTTSKRIEEILCFDPPRRLVSRLAQPEGDATHSFAEWRLFPLPGGCTLEMSVFWIDQPKGATATWAETTALRRGYVAHTQAIIEPYLAKMRRLAEQ